MKNIIKDLSGQEWQIILESLNYSKLKFEEYQGYPSSELKHKKISEVNHLIDKIKLMLKSDNLNMI